MILTPQQISQCIDNAKFRDAERGIVHFVLFNANEKNELNVASSNDALESNTQQNQLVLEANCTNYVTVITKLFCHPRYSPSEEIISTFLSYKFVIEWLFTISVWKNTDAIIEHLGLAQVDRFGQIKVNTNRKKVTVLLALICLSSKFRLPWKLLFKANPAIALSSYIGLVTQSIPALSQESNAGFNYLLESAKDLPMFDLPVVEDLGKLNYGFFNCSYATSPNKYAFKKWLTSLISYNLPQWLDQDVKEYIANIKPLKSKEKLKVVVMLERYSTNHAMHRCYHAMFENLAKKYELVAFCDEKKMENSSLNIFENVIELKDVFSINENTALIAKEQPDIIFYPSIGMKFWGIYLSQLRLAPLQVMMGGHPSSSFSPEIDYFLLSGHSFSLPQLQEFINEPIITSDEPIEKAQVHTMHNQLTPEFIDEHSHYLTSDSEVRVAINGILTKVTNNIVNICKQIQLKSSKKVTFVFFSNHQQNQLAYLAAKKQLSRELKHFELECFVDYLSYMKIISDCHFLLPTLPFGGSNSNVDTMVLIKPKLFIRGNSHIYTRTDQWNWQLVELDNELGCDSEDELIRKSLQLVEDSSYRHDLYIKMTEKCQIEKIFDTNNESDFISPLLEKVISRVTDNHGDL
jgi:predicted O-linked N-acetylglucosamine transferase (SPINDLY family)